MPHCPVSACAIRGRGPGPGVAGTVGRIAIHGYAGQGACQSIIPGTIHTEVSIIMLAQRATSTLGINGVFCTAIYMVCVIVSNMPSICGWVPWSAHSVYFFRSGFVGHTY